MPKLFLGGFVKNILFVIQHMGCHAMSSIFQGTNDFLLHIV